jgi:hypothetical protein
MKAIATYSTGGTFKQPTKCRACGRSIANDSLAWRTEHENQVLYCSVRCCTGQGPEPEQSHVTAPAEEESW